ncbi:hypothetical protein HN51_069363 [Arachis hypogaea]|nr:uncharacterized protein DS421_15g499730 [Arachis hypogaea]
MVFSSSTTKFTMVAAFVLLLVAVVAGSDDMGSMPGMGPMPGMSPGPSTSGSSRNLVGAVITVLVPVVLIFLVTKDRII